MNSISPLCLLTRSLLDKHLYNIYTFIQVYVWKYNILQLYV